MKTESVILLIAIILFITNCGDNKAASDETQQANNPSSEKKDNAASNASAQGNDIIGEWELLGFVSDTNDNLQVDEEERKNLTTPSFKDYMKLNSDGSGLFTIAKMDGRYEAKPKENGGKNYLTWFDTANGPHKIGTIVKVTKDELHIKEPGGNGLFIWKRL